VRRCLYAARVWRARAAARVTPVVGDPLHHVSDVLIFHGGTEGERIAPVWAVRAMPGGQRLQALQPRQLHGARKRVVGQPEAPGLVALCHGWRVLWWGGCLGDRL